MEAAKAVAATPKARLALVAPTGTGKGTLMLAIAANISNSVITTPSGEIARGLLDRLGATDPVEEIGDAALWRIAEDRGIYTPVRLRNRLEAGSVPVPAMILADECHHATDASASVWGRIVGELAPEAAVVGFTATPYRGSQQETAALREWWGEPHVLLSIENAAGERFLSIPEPKTWPLFEDSDVQVIGGEFDDESAADEADRLKVGELLAARLRAERWIEDGRWVRPTLIAGPTVRWCRELAGRLSAGGIPAEPISGDVPRAERDRLLARCQAREIALVQVKVLAEGVDMPWLRRLIDVRPIKSPVAWMQLLGRITRPVSTDETAPEYVSVTRNLSRHAYLLSGTWPTVRIAVEADLAFGGAGGGHGGETALERGVAKDALRSRKRVEIPLFGGGVARGVFLSRPSGWSGEDHVLVVGVPGEAEPRVFARRNTGSGEGRTWGKWSATKLESAGYAGWTAPNWASGKLSPNQAAWWRRDAASRGLDPDAKVAAAAFPILPALVDSGARLPTAPAAATPSPIATPVIVSSGPAQEQAAAGSTTRSATWARLRSGQWGGRVSGADAVSVAAGDTVVLRSQDGREKTGRVRSVESRGTGYALVAIEEVPAPTPNPAPVAAAPVDLGPEVPVGRYAVRNGDGLIFYRARINGEILRLSGAPGALRETLLGASATRLARKAISADPESGPRFGQELGICYCCGSPLTDTASRAAGVGPVCAQRQN